MIIFNECYFRNESVLKSLNEDENFTSFQSGNCRNYRKCVVLRIQMKVNPFKMNLYRI